VRARRTPETTVVFRLDGGNEDNDLWVKRGRQDGMPFVESVWELDDEERAAIAAGGTVELRVYTEITPPVSLAIGPSLDERNRRDPHGRLPKPKPDGGRIHG
jgi:hypothetical protein